MAVIDWLKARIFQWFLKSVVLNLFRETGSAEVVKQGKMRWLHQNELQAILKEELTLQDVSMTFSGCLQWAVCPSVFCKLELFSFSCNT